MDAFYTATSALKANQAAIQDTLNSLANTDTPGFLATLPKLIGDPNGTIDAVSNTTGTTISAPIATQVAAAQSIQLSSSPIQSTNTPTNLALTQSGFFKVRTPQGEAWTRDGQFTPNADGEWTTPQGWVLLSTQGTPIHTTAAEFRVTSSGQILSTGQPPQQIATNTLQEKGFVIQANGSVTGTPTAYTGSITNSAINLSNQSLTDASAQLMQYQTAYSANASALQQMVTTEQQTEQVGTWI